ncbi:bifunctional protein: acetyl-glutamate kinase; acetyl-ornithine deacetylase [Streptomyces spiroverticillatus]|uniref:Bifunctional protein: acetyl-glutamate kinase acetyl-ornithine deacetylase n=1 Tax=Streptomyces finlayi TaxID=67296 RepID=A0A919CDC1_9ACTN|nr:M20/M25/M40 family metallo-hydrolase [Streptomyces finlayi]GHA31907.1 bifunctional protein: acetyl-glutamate kinase; acetyl-ornithine deacetylase [Streptomyces spiroverticillatus]GHD10836.1 bifunctional protein: acetyl-glutamate kinase; acetyl-ornithine deacetylase [Streptomyces finlayi]
MPALEEAASSREAALYVVKLGSATLAHRHVYDELLALRRRGARLLVVAGGAAGIAEHYRRTGREIRTLVSRTGDDIRYCPPQEMPHIVAAYEQVTLPLIEEELTGRGLSVFAAVARTGALVRATVNGPLRVRDNGRLRVVRDHRAGTVAAIDVPRINALLRAFDVVCLSPPVADAEGGSALNVDADVLAGELARALDADHLRLVTGTAGLLADPADAASTLHHIGPGEGGQYARGRMRQKVRAAEIAVRGTSDTAITGPHTLSTASSTRFWGATPPAPDLNLLSRAVQISSVSRDERELAEFLAAWCSDQGLKNEIDTAGNLVVTKGAGDRRLLMLGHLDTVPHRWPVRWDGDVLHGRGSVDAKGSLVTFLQTLAAYEPPEGVELRVVGAVEEEITAAGAFHVRDTCPADAVIVGEPSGASALTLGYYGLIKFRLHTRERVGHTAGEGVRTAGDRLVEALAAVRAAVADVAPDALTATLGASALNEGDVQAGEAVVDVRLPPGHQVETVLDAVRAAVREPVLTEVLRATPGVATPRTSPLVKAFQRAFQGEESRPRYLLKKGSSDMNTLATTWHDVPMVAYGPGDASLDHTPDEHLHAAEFRRAQRLLTAAVREWSTM